VTDAFYIPTAADNVFHATEHTAGPWDPKLQHGGPPSALLARAVETTPESWPSTVVRMAVEILGPTPVGEVRVNSQVARAGRSVELVEAELSAGGRVAVRARAWRVRRADLDLPPQVAVPTKTPDFPPEPIDPPKHWPSGFIDAMDVRFTKGAWDQLGPAIMWARFKVPLVEGEQPTGLQRLMTLADCGNGVSGSLPIGKWIFINPDLTVHLNRYPVGEWLCIEATTTADPSGFGLAASTLYDRSGQVGHGAQSLFIDRR
jgi:hypothetical protein